MTDRPSPFDRVAHHVEINAAVREAGISDLRFLSDEDRRAIFRSRRAPAAAAAPAAPATGAGNAAPRPAQAAAAAPPAPTAAQAYRSRVAEFMDAPGAAQRQRQALRLATNTDLHSRFASNILAQLPTDAEADPAPAPASVASPIPLSPEIDAERRRIVSVLTHAEAEGREQLAKTLAFETSVDAAAAIAILAGTARAVRHPTIEERARGQAEFGDEADAAPQGRTGAADRAWQKVLAPLKAGAGQARPGGQDRPGAAPGAGWMHDPVMQRAIELAKEGFVDGRETG